MYIMFYPLHTRRLCPKALVMLISRLESLTSFSLLFRGVPPGLLKGTTHQHHVIWWYDFSIRNVVSSLTWKNKHASIIACFNACRNLPAHVHFSKLYPKIHRTFGWCPTGTIKIWSNHCNALKQNNKWYVYLPVLDLNFIDTSDWGRFKQTFCKSASVTSGDLRLSGDTCIKHMLLFFQPSTM